MKVSQEFGSADVRITAHEAGRLRINEDYIDVPVVVSPQQHQPWQPAFPATDPFESLSDQHFAALLDWQPEILLFGSGARQRFPSAALLQPLLQAGIPIEVMDTPAACRTFNILMAEDRLVVAALLMIEG